MANTIRIKRRPSSGSAGAPSSASLYNGELAFNENDNILYYAYGSGVGGISTAVPAIAGSGAYSLRGGSNASGTWPISVNGNSASVTNGVYTTGEQTVGGQKRFSASPIVSGNLAGQLIFQSANAVNGGHIIFDGVNLGSETSYIKSSTAGIDITHGTKIQLNSALEVVAANTSSNSVGYFAVFDSNPASSLTTLKSVSKDQILDDIGAATSGLDITAGSGLLGGGTLSQNRRFDIGQGDGITVSADAIAVDSTVVRTTGNQSINGVKTFGNRINISHTGSFANIPSLNIGGGGDNYFDYYTGQQGVSSGYFLAGLHGDTSSAPFRITFDLVGGAAITNGEWRASTIAVDKGGTGATTLTSNNILVGNGTNAISAPYSVETTLTGGSGALPRADAVKTYVDNMIGSGIATNDAMIFKGTIDCSTNPNYPAADRGWVYKISVAGRIGGASGPVVEVNDTIICGTDGTAAGTHASVGGNWNILQTNIVDASILVTGPTSATSGNFAMFDGTTGKIVKDSSLSSSSFATAGHVHGNITNAGAIGSTANLPIITTTAGALTTGSFGSTANTFCQGNDSRLSDTRNTTQSLTVNNGGGGTASSFTFNGGTAQTISYNSIGAPSISGTNATGTWNISVTGNAGTVTSGIYTYGSYADPSWITSLAKSKVGLSNVENTALSTWAGSANLTTLGTVVTGTWNATTIAVDKGGTGQTSYTNGQLLIGNTTGNTLTKATLTQGTAIDITNSTGSITIGHNDTSTLTGAQGSNGIASFTVDGMGHVTAVTTATYLTAGTVCAAIADCSLDGGTF
jgi:hypothetical protein